METKFEIMHALNLKPLEREVLHFVMEGWSNVEIATQLGMTERTVKKYVTILLDASGTDTRTRLMAKLWEQGWGFKKPVVDSGILPRGRN